jgi:protein tyrosine kinase modulator
VASAAARRKNSSTDEDDKNNGRTNIAAKNSQTNEPLVGSPEAVKALSAERERIALLNAQLTAIGVELKTRQADQQKILSQVENVQARLHRLPLREQEMAQVTRDYEMSKANYRSLEEKIFAADMASEMEHNQKSERFMVLDSARMPEKPISPNRPLFAGVGSAVALALSLGFWLFCDIRKNKLMGEWELPDGIVVLGRVPDLLLAEGGGILSLRLVTVSAAVIAALSVASVAAYLIWMRH